MLKIEQDVGRGVSQPSRDTGHVQFVLDGHLLLKVEFDFPGRQLWTLLEQKSHSSSYIRSCHGSSALELTARVAQVVAAEDVLARCINVHTEAGV